MAFWKTLNFARRGWLGGFERRVCNAALAWMEGE
jgi:hypothetical protein